MEMSTEERDDFMAYGDQDIFNLLISKEKRSIPPSKENVEGKVPIAPVNPSGELFGDLRKILNQ